MNVDVFTAVYREFGWLVLLIYFFMREVWPWFKKKVWPMKYQASLQEEERRVRGEERSIAATEKISEAVQQMAIVYATVSLRLEQLQAMGEKHDLFTQEAVQAMYKRVGVRK
jgi:hypothetical protein